MSPTRKFAAFVLAGAFLSGTALAQEAGPSPEEVKQKVLEIERLMKKAEESLARSTDTRSAAERSAEAARKILDDKARQATGKSAEELRKEAESGSKEAAETLEKLTKAANDETAQAAKKMGEVLDGGANGSSGSGTEIRKLLEAIKGEGQGAAKGIKWLLDNTKSSKSGGGGGGGSESKEKPKDEPKGPEEKPEDKSKKPPEDQKKPPQHKEPPQDPQFQQWLAELPPQVRKAYETEDWDSIPPKWRDLLRAWTKKMADELEKERR